MLKSVDEIFSLFFRDNENELSNIEVIETYLANEDVIVLGLEGDNDTFLKSLHLISDYCLALADEKRFGEAIPKINFIIPFFDKYLETEKEKFDNHFYSKLIWNRMLGNFHLGLYEKSKSDIDDLCRHFPDMALYFRWKDAVNARIKPKGLKNIFRRR